MTTPKIIVLLFLFVSTYLEAASATLTVSNPGCVIPSGQTMCTMPITWSATNAPNAGVFIANGTAYWTGTQGTKNFIWTKVTPTTIYVKLNKFDSNSQILAQTQVWATPEATASATLTVSNPGCVIPSGQIMCTMPITWSATNAPNAGVFIANGTAYWTSAQGTKSFIWTKVTPTTIYVKLNRLDSNSQILAQVQVWATTGNTPYSLFKGGSNLNWYSHGDPQNGGTIRSLFPFGIIKNYHTSGVRSTVQNLLQQMFSSGQRRLRVGIFHTRNIVDFGAIGTQLDSSRKFNQDTNRHYHINPIYLNNLLNYLNDIENAGFEEVIIGMFPQVCNSPFYWRKNYFECQQDIEATFDGENIIGRYNGNGLMPLWTENWRVIKEVVNIANQSQVNYKLDLGNERIPTSEIYTWATCGYPSSPNPCDTTMPSSDLLLYQARWENYLKKVWNKYVNKYGNINTVGYSFSLGNVAEVHSKASVLANIYGTNFPKRMSFHIYDRGNDQQSCSNSSKSAYCKYKTLANVFSYLDGIILGEVFYNDLETALELQDAIDDTGVTPDYILQWPLARSPVYYSHPAPLIYNNYSSEGF